ncbi:MAG: hypothetical protein ACFFB3_11585 [Candidatus Hodarchaeota archaeon]
MISNKPRPVLVILLVLAWSMLLFPAIASFRATSLEHDIAFADVRTPQQSNSQTQLASSSKTTSPATLDAEFVNPNYPNYMQAFVNVSFAIRVRLRAIDFNYTRVNATITLDPLQEDPVLTLVDTSIRPENIATKFIGNITAGENKTITWYAIPVRYDAIEAIRLARFNATGLMNDQIPRLLFKTDLIEVHQPLMNVEGPFPLEEHDMVDYELDYGESKTLMLNITSSINSTCNLTGLRVTVTTDEYVEASYFSAELNPLAPGEFYIYNFTIKSISKKAAKSMLTIEIASTVTPLFTLELTIGVLEAPEDEGFGFSPVGSVMMLSSAFITIILLKRRTR